MSKNKKDWYSESDSAKPYRLICPKLSLSVMRYESEKGARLDFGLCKEKGHQAILSRLDTQTLSTKIIAYCKAVTTKC